MNIIKSNSRQINMDKLADLCRKKNVWDHFKMSKEDFFDLSDPNQKQLTSKFYFDNVDNQPSIDESISNIIKNSDGVNLTKIFDNVDNQPSIDESISDIIKNSDGVNLTKIFDNVDNQPSIDESISDIIKNSDGVKSTKIFDNENNRTQMSISTEKKQDEKKLKSTTMWKNDGFFRGDDLPQNNLFYVNQGYLIYFTAQKILLALQPVQFKK